MTRRSFTKTGALWVPAIAGLVRPSLADIIVIRRAPAVGGSPITLGGHDKVGGVSSGTTPTINSTGATLLVAGVAAYENSPSGQLVTVSDSKTNTWTPLTNYPADTSPTDGVRLYYVANPTVGTLHTASFSGANTYCSLFFAAFNNVKTTSPAETPNGASGGAAATIQPGSITPAENNELIVSLVHQNSTSAAPTINSGFTIIDTLLEVGGVNVGGGLAYLVQTTAAAVNPTWTSGTLAKAATQVSFKAP